MKDYSTYTALEFILDQNFQEWVQHPDENSNAYWKEVILLYPDKKVIIDEASKALQSLKFNPIPTTNIPEEKLLTNILDKVHQDRKKSETSQPPTHHINHRHLHFNNWVKVAASIALLISFSFALYSLFNNRATQFIETAYGETREVFLPDSSSVMLNANSSLQFTKDWDNEADREVWLNGEAYFRVAKVALRNTSDKDQQSQEYQKFVVHTQDLDVVVLGTSFNVNQRQEKTQVVLAEGKVEVMINSEQKRVSMVPGELLEYIPLQHNIAKAIVSPEVYSSWQTHQLIFDGIPLSQVAQRLEEIFGYDVVCSDEIKDLIFKGTVPSDDIEVSLTVIQNAFGIRVTRSNGRIIFSK